ncbi:MAG TPA: nucleotide exchange factor GrpE [Thermoanaerobaculia bacterium]|jgi:molecular chaperone GrpE
MSGKFPGEPQDEALEIEDSGATLESALEEEERTSAAALEEKLQSAQRDISELRDRHLRKLAEFENLRKRNERERAENHRNALAEMAREFLPVLDNIERAMQHATAQERQGEFGQGIGMIRRQFVDVWKKLGVEEVDTRTPFDPNVHEAVAKEENPDLPHHTILEVLQRGYRIGDRLVRPALVKVSVRPGGESSENAG